MNYPVRIHRIDQKFFLQQEDLGLLITDNTLESAYQTYLKEENILLEKYRQLGELPPAPQPSPTMINKQYKRQLYLKIIFWCLGILIPIVLLSAAIREAPRLITLYLPKALDRSMDVMRSNLESVVQRLRDMSPENQYALQQDLEIIGSRFSPLVQGLFQTIQCPNEPIAGKPHPAPTRTTTD